MSNEISSNSKKSPLIFFPIKPMTQTNLWFILHGLECFLPFWLYIFDANGIPFKRRSQGRPEPTAFPAPMLGSLFFHFILPSRHSGSSFSNITFLLYLSVSTRTACDWSVLRSVLYCTYGQLNLKVHDFS